MKRMMDRLRGHSVCSNNRAKHKAAAVLHVVCIQLAVKFLTCRPSGSWANWVHDQIASPHRPQAIQSTNRLSISLELKHIAIRLEQVRAQIHSQEDSVFGASRWVLESSLELVPETQIENIIPETQILETQTSVSVHLQYVTRNTSAFH
jgi:hypothetical protein